MCVCVCVCVKHITKKIFKKEKIKWLAIFALFYINIL